MIFKCAVKAPPLATTVIMINHYPCLSPVLQPCGSEELSSTRSNWVEIRSMHACTEHWQVPWSVELGTGPNQGLPVYHMLLAGLLSFPWLYYMKSCMSQYERYETQVKVSGSVNPTVRRTEKRSNSKGHSRVTGSQFQHFFNLQVAEARKQALRTNMRKLHNGFPQPSLLHRLGSPWYLPLCKVYVDGMERIGVRPRVFKSTLSPCRVLAKCNRDKGILNYSDN